MTPIKRALAFIGLDLDDPEGASLLEKIIYSLLIFIPIAVAVRLLHLPEWILFVTAALAIMPLAKILGTATEELAGRVGSGIGGLLNATFGNATEMIIALVALNAGLYEVVKASITGSIIGNILFVLGLALFLGGLGREKQVFNRTGASVSASAFALAAAGLSVPTFFLLATHGESNDAFRLNAHDISIGVAVVLFLAYIGQLVFYLRTHAKLFTESEEHAMHSGAIWTIRHSVIVLGVTTLVIAVMAEFLVEGVQFLTEELHWSETFVGVILVAVIGNAAEHLTAVTVAMRNRMDLALAIANGSTLQIALFVAPMLMFAGVLLGHPEMNLVFGLFELFAVGVALYLTSIIGQDGESNWLEGLQLLAAYAILAIAFFFVP